MDNSEQRFLDHLGVTAWHEAGYTGKRGLTASAEEVDGSGDHDSMTKKVFQLFAPDRELVYLSCSGRDDASGRTSKFVDDGIPIIKDRHVDTMYKSLTCSSSGTFYDPYLEDVKDYFTFFACAANGADVRYNRDLESKWIYGVGAYYLMNETNEMRPTVYSSISDYVDFAAPTNIYSFPGTSCATPALCGMAALVNDFFIDKTGRSLSSEKMYQFLKDCSVDIGDKGKDGKTGWGAPILPPPDEVDIQKYAGGNFMIYEDDAKISEWHKDDVYKAYQLGLMKGDGDKFEPQSPVTREQLATTLVRLYDALKK